MSLQELVIGISAWVVAGIGFWLFDWPGGLYGLGSWIVLGTVLHVMKGET